MSELDYLKSKVGTIFSDNFSSTGASLLIRIEEDRNKAYYTECYSQYANVSGRRVDGSKRTDELYHPQPGLNTMSIAQLERCIIGVI
jgi:hypothetical protein|tara:strand:+ start:185 stop:445 length:261 start_codon:yes stop_codon:yes gene_type:complete